MQALFKTSVKNLIYLALFITCSLTYGQQWSTPVIEGYGGIVYDPTTSVQPRKNYEYKLLYKITDDEIWLDKDGASADSQNTITAGLMYRF